MNKLQSLSLQDDKPMWDIWMSMWSLAVLSVASEIKLFISLEKEAKTIKNIAGRLSVNYRGAEILVNILVHQGFLKKQGEKIALTSMSRAYLVPNSPFYWGAQFEAFCERAEHKRILGALTQDKYQLNHGGKSFTEMWEVGSITKEAAENFTQKMHATIFTPAIAAIKSNLFKSTNNLLDMGGGSGCFSIAYVDKYKTKKATVFELPTVSEVTKKYIKKFKVLDKVSIYSGNFFRDEWPTGHDAILFSQILHDWNLDQCKILIKKSYDALAHGGKIFIHEMLFEKNRINPLTIAYFDLLMFLNHRSQQFNKDELVKLLKEAGFKKPQVKKTFGYFFIVTAVKL